MPLHWIGSDNTLVNASGHLAGVLLFVIFLQLALRRSAPVRTNGLSLLAASLALLWNAASLLVVLSNNTGGQGERAVAAFGFCILSLLPAVLFRLCLGTRQPGLIYIGYALSSVAVTCHIAELFPGVEDLHRLGLQVITIGFGALTAFAVFRILFAKEKHNRSETSRIVATMSLFLFAISFVHFGVGHLDHAWSQELLFHHAGIPLALFVLLQDYRFVLADAFVRLVANGFMAVLFGWAAVTLGSGQIRPVQILIVCVFVALFGLVRDSAQALLTRLAFRQPAPGEIEASLAKLRSVESDEATYLRAAGQEMARLMEGEFLNVTTVLPSTHAAELLAATPIHQIQEPKELQKIGVAAIVPIHTSSGGARHVLLGQRKGGQPYLSLDLDILSRLAGAAAEQVERIRGAETVRLVARAELTALQAQIHPHFLFNALNTLYGIIPREASLARKTVLNIADIFRYFLRSDKTFVGLAEEMEIVKAYLAIEAQRLGPKLTVEISVDESLLREPIPVLSIEPLVENAVKHGIAPHSGKGTVSIRVSRVEENKMRVAVCDSGPGFRNHRKAASSNGAGMGLDNVSRRLQLCYGDDVAVEVDSGNGQTRVSFLVPIGANVATAAHR